jgi:hypothetical protein
MVALDSGLSERNDRSNFWGSGHDGVGKIRAIGIGAIEGTGPCTPKQIGGIAAE